jgi:translocation and assembly module TamA
MSGPAVVSEWIKYQNLSCNNKTSLSCRTLFLIFVLFISSPLFASAGVKVAITVEGIHGELHNNVLARLKLNLHKNNERLKDNEVRRLHRQAEEDIREALEPFGYYHPEVSSSLEYKNDTWLAMYTVRKGEPVLVEEIQLDLTGEGGNDKNLRAALEKFPLKSGDVLDQEKYRKWKKELVSYGITEGFLDAYFSRHEIRVDLQRNRADVILQLDTGARYLFGRTLSRQEIIKSDLLKRYLPYREGDPYSPAKLFELQSILYKTDFFSSVEARGDTDNPHGIHIPVTVDLKPPKHRNKYTLGAGYATDTGAREKIDWSNRLFNKKGHKLKASLQVAELENSFSLLYTVPRNDPRYEKLVHGLAYQDKKWNDTDTRLLTAAVSSEYADPRYKYGIGIELRDEVYDVGSTSGKSRLLIPSLKGGFILADDILDTKMGMQASIEILGAAEGFLADATFLQITVSGKAILSPFDRWRLIGRGSLGATIVDSIDSLPPSLRFYTGGDSSIRGYKYKSIGTKDSSGAVIGGRYLVVGSVELERRFSDHWSCAGFWDVGSATDDLRLDFFQGAGLGVRFRLPFGQIRLDLASAVSEDGYPMRIHFTVGGDL